MGYYDLAKLSTIDLKRLAAGCVAAALGNPSYKIPKKSVIPQELSSKRFFFRINKETETASCKMIESEG